MNGRRNGAPYLSKTFAFLSFSSYTHTQTYRHTYTIIHKIAKLKILSSQSSCTLKYMYNGLLLNTASVPARTQLHLPSTTTWKSYEYTHTHHHTRTHTHICMHMRVCAHHCGGRCRRSRTPNKNSRRSRCAQSAQSRGNMN